MIEFDRTFEINFQPSSPREMWRLEEVVENFNTDKVVGFDISASDNVGIATSNCVDISAADNVGIHHKDQMSRACWNFFREGVIPVVAMDGASECITKARESKGATKRVSDSYSYLRRTSFFL